MVGLERRRLERDDLRMVFGSRSAPSRSAPTPSVRAASKADIPRLVRLNHDAYPELVEDGVVFDGPQLMAQQAVFPEGQIVVELGGRIVGAIATLIVGKDAALGAHSWSDITSYGTFAGHEPTGDTLYLADIYTDLSVRADGVRLGPILYDALFRLCERRGLARVVAGGRLWGYHEVADRMPPTAYVDEVVAGRRKDRVLGSQLRAGFCVRGILDQYLDDWRSAGYATLLVWDNVMASREKGPAVVGQNVALRRM